MRVVPPVSSSRSSARGASNRMSAQPADDARCMLCCLCFKMQGQARCSGQRVDASCSAMACSIPDAEVFTAVKLPGDKQ